MKLIELPLIDPCPEGARLSLELGLGEFPFPPHQHLQRCRRCALFAERLHRQREAVHRVFGGASRGLSTPDSLEDAFDRLGPRLPEVACRNLALALTKLAEVIMRWEEAVRDKTSPSDSENTARSSFLECHRMLEVLRELVSGQADRETRRLQILAEDALNIQLGRLREFPERLRVIDSLLSAAKTLGKNSLAKTVIAGGMLEWYYGDVERVSSLFETALSIARSRRDRSSVLSNLSVWHCDRGEVNRALELSELACSQRANWHFPWWNRLIQSLAQGDRRQFDECVQRLTHLPIPQDFLEPGLVTSVQWTGERFSCSRRNIEHCQQAINRLVHHHARVG